MLLQRVAHVVRANKASSASDEYGFHTPRIVSTNIPLQNLTAKDAKDSKRRGEEKRGKGEEVNSRLISYALSFSPPHLFSSSSLLFAFFASFAVKIGAMAEITPEDGMKITRDTRLAPGVYFLPHGIEVGADHVTLDGNGALLIGD